MLEKLLASILPMVLSNVSDVVVKALVEFLDVLDEKAKSTPNEWDNMLVSLLRVVIQGVASARKV